MNKKISVVLMDCSKQLGNNPFFNYTRTYQYSIRINGEESIQLTETEYKICLLLREAKGLSTIEKELTYDKTEIIKAYTRLEQLGIVKVFNNQSQYDFKVFQPYILEIEGIRHFPRTIVWNITQRCNLSCKHCIERCIEKGSGDKLISLGLIERMLDEMSANGLERLQISGGEPTCSPIFRNIVELALDRDICIDVFTNAFCIDEALHELFKKYILCKPNSITFHISVDGDEKSHNYLRGSDSAYTKTVDNIKRIISYGGTINVETIVHRKNMDVLESVIKILIDLKIKYVYMHPMFHPGKDNIYEKPLTDEERLSVFLSMANLAKKYKNDIEIKYMDPFFPVLAYHLSKRFSLPFRKALNKDDAPINCMAGVDKMYINSEGEVYPCLLFDKSKRDYCGSILEHSLLDLWKSKGMDFVRKPIYESMLMCARCDYNKVCNGKIKSCRRAVELTTNDYLGVIPACEALNG